MRWRQISLASIALSLLIATAIFGPPGFDYLRSKNEARKKAQPTLQTLIESGEIRHLESTASISSLLPYDSISLETTPCFGACPIFILTFRRDGQATLITDQLLPKERKKLTGKIWAQEYARLTQLVTLAKSSAKEARYAGTWTDDTSSIIKATSGSSTWEVTDYGGVSPPEVWALNIVMRDLKERIEWAPQTGG